MSAGNARDLAMFVAAYARLQHTGPTVLSMLEDLASGTAERLLYRGNVQALSDVLWAYAKLGACSPVVRMP